MPLARTEFKVLHWTVLEAFTRNDLEHLLRLDLGLVLDDIVSPGNSESVVFDLIDWLGRQGRTKEFLEAIARARPQNQEVQRTVAALGGTAVSGSPSAAPIETLNSVGEALSIVDQIARPLERLSSGVTGPVTEAPLRVRSVKKQDAVLLVDPNSIVLEHITADQIGQLLPPESQLLIQALEARMQEAFKRWTELYPKRGLSPTTQENDSVEQELRRLAEKFCSDLSDIFHFLQSMNYNLQDHYIHIEYICKNFKP
jgi:hypothetical protein